MINSSSSGSSEITAGSSSSGHVQFRMTVKVDIEGHVPAAAVAAAGSCSSDQQHPPGSVVSSSSTSSDVLVANAATGGTAAGSSTQDLLLKLQPLLPHLCIKHQPPPPQQDASASGSSVLQQQQQQKQQEILMPPPSPNNLAKNTANHPSAPPSISSAADESGLELSLGLSLFNSNKSLAAAPGENLRTASSWAASSKTPQQQNHPQQSQNPQQQQPQQQQMLQRSESMVDWRLLEQQRLKREVQCQKRQEARKKRRILIDEQKQQRKAAAAARSSASSPPGSSLMKSRKMRSSSSSVGRDPGAGNAGLELPQIVEQDDPEGQEPRNRMNAARHHSKFKTGTCHPSVGGRKKRNTHSGSLDSANFAAVAAAAAGVKIESEDPEQSGTTTVIRPSPIVVQQEPNNQWVQKFLEMQKMVNPSKSPSSCCSDKPGASDEQEQHDSSSHHHQHQHQEQEEQEFRHHPARTERGEDDDESRKLEQDRTVGLTRQGSFQSRSLGSPPPRTGTTGGTGRTNQGGGGGGVVDSSQCSSVVSAASGFPIGASSNLMLPPGSGSSFMTSPPRDSSKSRLQDHPGPSLFRTTSLGTYRSREEFLQNQAVQQQQQQQQQQHSTIRMPSPIRSIGSQHGLMRTLSEGAAMRNLAASLDQESKPPDLANRNNASSAFKSPKKEPQEHHHHHHHADLKPPPLQQRQLNRSSSMIQPGQQQSGEAARSMQQQSTTDLPWVSTTGTGPNGRTVRGVLFAYKKGEVKIVCACHGQHMSARQFVEHAGGVDVANPEKCIVVSPPKRFTFNIPTTTAS